MTARRCARRAAGARMGRWRRGDTLSCALVAILSLALWTPTLISGDRLHPNDDFLIFAARHEGVRKSVLEHGELPLRSPWLGGGYPTLGEPEDPALNPLVLLSLLFGSAMGVKLIPVVTSIAGGVSAYVLGRRVLGYTPEGAWYVAAAAATSVYVPLRMRSGNINEAYAALLPAVLLFLGLAVRGRRWAVWPLAALAYVTFCDGKLLAFTLWLCAGLLCLWDLAPGWSALGDRRGRRAVDARPLKFVLIGLALALLIGLVRFLPMLAFLHSLGGVAELDYDRTAPLAFWGPRPAEFFPTLASAWFGGARPWTAGVVPLVCMATAVGLLPRKMAPWAVTAALFGWLTLSGSAPIDLFGLLRRLPVFAQIRWPHKYFSFQLVYLTVLGAGQAFHVARAARPRWAGRLAAVSLIGWTLLVGGFGVLSAQGDLYTVAVQDAAQQPFHQVCGLGLRRDRVEPWEANAYYNTRRNVGVIDWCATFYLDERAAPKFLIDQTGAAHPNPDYRGEVYFLAPENEVRAAALHPNTIAVHVDVRRPGLLVINQNHHPAWRASVGRVGPHQGLLAVRLDRPGAYRVKLRYRPASFSWGLAGSAAALVLAAWAGWRLRRGRVAARLLNGLFGDAGLWRLPLRPRH